MPVESIKEFVDDKCFSRENEVKQRLQMRHPGDNVTTRWELKFSF